MSDNTPWANKRLGQHFLNDPQVISAICSDFINLAELMVEVGPGAGALTSQLAEQRLPLLLVEKDIRFKERLTSLVSSEQIIFADALSLSLGDAFAERRLDSSHVWLISNLPYNISVPLTMSFIQTPQIRYMTLMFQREVGEKIVIPASVPGQRKRGQGMNSLAALLQNYFECRLLCHVPPSSFSPPPKVDSIVISCQRRDAPRIGWEQFKSYESFLRQMFAMKRKQLHKVLRSHYLPEQLDPVFERCGIDPKVRAETFNLDQVQLLYEGLILRENGE
ncbi:MAG: ribosomal RNA small subunit methyltransferase A [Bdellovibrionales bacterium]|jgi:16S rRNA (adenine1518-N6/adenine1519-N6)-dimethyltransferase|nr:ribosomal RNA small subunit methyltransferase A [Bdellovibrionales bacterium]MBT3525854.1 ribosomal RNA small subunit methyltransferase A [Bdellovibrionales bacterium]MBT7668743.1 ribosomal RNA small subunit methyltransferase A [Bdellovibrionales bacterium]MBT7766590.1 ribosomal RNA small subunit methyltransferase A [Bdellovibrionales bacterium]